MNELDLKQDILNAEKASQLVRDLTPYLEACREECYKNIRKSFFFQKDQREEAYKVLRAIDLFENKLIKDVNNGKVAKHKLKQKR